MSLMQQAEQELIERSVFIDKENSQAIAHLPFKADPKEFLSENTHIARKRLQNVCNKYHKDEPVRKTIIEAFDKLRTKGHLKFYEDLTVKQKTRLESAEIGYTIPWDLVWKESSPSTPARTVYDASSKTPSGHSLNDLLATGVPDLVNLLELVLDWQVGPVAFVGDVSQFYCTIKLMEESWPFQKLLLREDLNPNGKLIKAVIIKAIFGVCSSGGQSEVVMRMVADLVKDSFPQVAKVLLKKRYVHDIRKLIEENASWDDPISARMRLRWVENFGMIEDVRDIMYVRCPRPADAVSLKARIWILGDAADCGIMIAVYSCFELPYDVWT